MGAKTVGWKEIGDDMHTASERVVEDGKKVVGAGCLQIKKQARRIIEANTPHGYLVHYKKDFSYDVTAHATDIIGEVGPDANKPQGGLARIIEYGSINSAPIPHLSPSLDAEAPRFARYVAELGQKLLNGQPGPDGPATDPGGG